MNPTPITPRLISLRLLALLMLFTLCSTPALADRANKMEYTFQLPYADGQTINFDGGASVDINDDVGFGFGIAYNYTNRFSLKGNFSWNSTSYDAKRILDDGSRTEKSIRGVLDTFAASFGGDYYLTDGKFSPYLSGGIGWTNLDSNISDGNGGTVCWWDPWWGYICDNYYSTYNKDTWFYGLGAGVRFDINPRSFFRFSVNKRWLDLDNTSGSSDFDIFSFEYGVTY